VDLCQEGAYQTGWLNTVYLLSNSACTASDLNYKKTNKERRVEVRRGERYVVLKTLQA
jgi:hypothetical protein